MSEMEEKKYGHCLSCKFYSGFKKTNPDKLQYRCLRFPPVPVYLRKGTLVLGYDTEYPRVGDRSIDGCFEFVLKRKVSKK